MLVSYLYYLCHGFTEAFHSSNLEGFDFEDILTREPTGATNGLDTELLEREQNHACL